MRLEWNFHISRGDERFYWGICKHLERNHQFLPLKDVLFSKERIKC